MNKYRYADIKKDYKRDHKTINEYVKVNLLLFEWENTVVIYNGYDINNLLLLSGVGQNYMIGNKIITKANMY